MGCGLSPVKPLDPRQIRTVHSRVRHSPRGPVLRLVGKRVAVFVQEDVDLMGFAQFPVDPDAKPLGHLLAIALHVVGHAGAPNANRPLGRQILAEKTNQ